MEGSAGFDLPLQDALAVDHCQGKRADDEQSEDKAAEHTRQEDENARAEH